LLQLASGPPSSLPASLLESSGAGKQATLKSSSESSPEQQTGPSWAKEKRRNFESKRNSISNLLKILVAQTTQAFDARGALGSTRYTQGPNH